MTQPQLCAVVTGGTMEEIRRGSDAASGADIVELRLDYADRPDAAAALEGGSHADRGDLPRASGKEAGSRGAKRSAVASWRAR